MNKTNTPTWFSEYRRQLCVSVADLMHATGASRRTVRRWDNETRVPRYAITITRMLGTGLPLLEISADIWQGWEFRRDGALYAPGGEHWLPGDLYADNQLANAWRRNYAATRGSPKLDGVRLDVAVDL